MLGLGKRKTAKKTPAKPTGEKELRALLKVAAEGQEAALRAITALKAEVAALRKAIKAKNAAPPASKPTAARRKPPAKKTPAPTE